MNEPTDELTLQERAERRFRPGRVDFVYRYGHDTCCAEVIFSDGERYWCFWPSNSLGNALIEEHFAKVYKTRLPLSA